MEMDDDPLEFEIDREGFDRYQQEYTLLFPTVFPFLFPFGLFFGFGIIMAAIWWFIARPYALDSARAFRCWIEKGQVLRIETGTVFKQSISLPMDRIISITVVQGPLMNRHGIWCLDIKANGGLMTPPNSIRLYALKSPEKARDILLDERRKALREIQAERYA